MRLYRVIASFLITAFVAAEQAFAQAGNPPGSGPILGAVNWVRGTMEGGIATAVAVIAVAFVGFMMLTGRMNWKHGITVIIGCFILFGAATIVGGIQSAAQASAG